MLQACDTMMCIEMFEVIFTDAIIYMPFGKITKSTLAGVMEPKPARKAVKSRQPRKTRAKRVARVPKTAAAQCYDMPGPGAGIAEKIGSSAGNILGGPAGAAIGGLLGKGASSLFKYITGHGDYKVRSNSLLGVGNVSMDTLPKFQTESKGVRVVHREYIQDVISSSSANTFSISSFPIQPAYTFPWLSTIAQQFQQYQINGMIFEFKTTSSDALNSTNTALGEVILSTQYNVNTPTPVNPAQMYQLEYVTTCKPSESIMHPIECAKGESMMFVLDTRNGSTGTIATSDLRLYDFANFFIATNGMQGTSVNIGQLWVSYDITLLKPQLGQTADLGDHYILPSSVTNNNFFGTTIPAASSTSDLGSVLAGTGGNGTITIPSSYTGNLMMVYSLYGSSTVGVAGPTIMPTTSGITALSVWSSNSTDTISAPGTVAKFIIIFTFKVVGGGVIQFTGGTGTFPTALTGGDLYLLSWPTTLIN